MPYFETDDGCRIFFQNQLLGSPKPLVVFLNGTAQTAVNWAEVSNLLKSGFQILTYDARSQGRSGQGSLPLSLEAHCGDLRDLLDHLGAKRAHLVGISHGAFVAVAFASRFPERVGRLVLCSVTARPTCRARLAVKSWLEILMREGIEAMAWAALPFMFGEKFLRRNEAILDKIVLGIVRRNKKECLIEHLRAVKSYPALAQLAPGLHCPALVISGGDDPMVTAEGAEELAGLCKGYYQQALGVGHSIPAEAPEWFVRMLRGFLAEDRQCSSDL